MVDLNAHEAGNGGQSQGKPTAHGVLLYSEGYDRIVGALANLGYQISDQTVGNVLKRHGIAPAPKRSQTTTFYEKVVKVKADVAAILNFFSRSIPQIEADSFWTRPGDPIGGMRKGGFSGAL